MRPEKNAHHCTECHLQQLCFSKPLDQATLTKITPYLRRIDIEKGQVLFNQNDPMQWLYAVQSGCIKYTSKEGNISAFFLPGDVFGADGIVSAAYQANAVAVEETQVCIFNYQQFVKQQRLHPELMQLIIEMVSSQVQIFMASLTHHKDTQQRLSAFLYKVSQSYQRRGFSGKAFRLPMSRHEIANFLDLALETVSRTLHGMQKQGILHLDNRQVTIQDYDAIVECVTA